MKLLFLTNVFPKPLNNGGKIRSFYVLRELVKHFDVSIACFREYELCSQDVYLPFLGRERCHALEFPLGVSLKTLRCIKDLPRWCNMYYSEEMQELINELMIKEDFKYLYISQSFMAYYALGHNNVLRTVDHYNIKTALYESARQNARSAISKIDYRAEYLKWHQYERNVLNIFERNVVCSERDKLLLKEFSTKPTAVIHSGVDTNQFYRRASLVDTPNLLFAGTLSYFPNIEGLEFFCSKCLPMVREAVPQVALHVVGRDAPWSLRRYLRKTKNVYTILDVEDIRPFYYQSAVAIVPILSGSGTRLKIPEAMATAIPVVSTSKGAEGLDLSTGEGIMIEDDPVRFAEAVIALLKDSQMRRALGEKACQVAHQRFDWEKTLVGLNEFIM